MRAEAEWAREVLERQVKQLRRLVDDLLDMSRITHGKIDLRFEAVDIAQVIAVAIETTQPSIDARRHTLTVRAPPHPVRVNGDFARLAQILANLLNNAAKYTDDGGQISLVAAPEGRSGRHLAFAIPEWAFQRRRWRHIFEPFRQLGSAADRPQGGLGVGLTLVKRLVEKHGGTIEVKSEGRAAGSEFVVRLPLLVGLAADAGPEVHVGRQCRRRAVAQATAYSRRRRQRRSRDEHGTSARVDGQRRPRRPRRRGRRRRGFGVPSGRGLPRHRDGENERTAKRAARYAASHGERSPSSSRSPAGGRPRTSAARGKRDSIITS